MGRVNLNLFTPFGAHAFQCVDKFLLSPRRALPVTHIVVQDRPEADTDPARVFYSVGFDFDDVGGKGACGGSEYELECVFGGDL